jgi:hypothetical protein
MSEQTTKKTKGGITPIYDPEETFKGDLDKIMEHFQKVDKIGCPSNRSQLAKTIIRHYTKYVERLKPEQFNPHALF